MSHTQIIEEVQKLGISLTDVRALISEESKTSTSSVTLLESIQAVSTVEELWFRCKILILRSQQSTEHLKEQFTQVSQTSESSSSRHDTLVAVLDRNHSEVSNLQTSIASTFESIKEHVSKEQTTIISSLDRISSELETRTSTSTQKATEILEVRDLNYCTKEPY
jgi:DNA-binding transcriptional MerR regulator